MTEVFEDHRRYLTGIAYRMLGSVAEAEDIVQDAYLRWREVSAPVESPRAYLATIVTRLSLDRLRSARVRREEYVGAWLPEPFVDDGAIAADAMADFANDLSIAMLMALERTSPLERAAFLLHDVFDQEFAEIARVLDRSEVACRQLATRARERVQAERPARGRASPEAIDAIVHVVRNAMTTGDLAPLVQRLAADCVLLSDGGGKRTAALNPILGKDKIVRFFLGLAASGKRTVLRDDQVRAATINGLPGFVLTTDDGVETMALELDARGQIIRIYGIRNPDKLAHLAPS